jgi:hypothetical protein
METTQDTPCNRADIHTPLDEGGDTKSSRSELHHIISFTSSSSSETHSQFISLSTPVANDMTVSSPDDVDYISPKGIPMKGLRYLNVFCGLSHLVQMVVFLVLAKPVSFPMMYLHTDGGLGSTHVEAKVIVNLPIKIIVSSVLGISGFFNLLTSAPFVYKMYARCLVDKYNYFRWIEYAITSPLVSVIMGKLVGIVDAPVLFLIFWLHMSVIFFAWLQERYEFPGTGGFTAIIFAMICSIMPWVMTGVYVFVNWGPQDDPYTLPVLSIVLFYVTLIFHIIYGIVKLSRYIQSGFLSVDYMIGEVLFILMSLSLNTCITWISYCILDCM